MFKANIVNKKKSGFFVVSDASNYRYMQFCDNWLSSSFKKILSTQLFPYERQRKKTIKLHKIYIFLILQSYTMVDLVTLTIATAPLSLPFLFSYPSSYVSSFLACRHPRHLSSLAFLNVTEDTVCSGHEGGTPGNDLAMLWIKHFSTEVKFPHCGQGTDGSFIPQKHCTEYCETFLTLLFLQCGHNG